MNTRKLRWLLAGLVAAVVAGAVVAVVRRTRWYEEHVAEIAEAEPVPGLRRPPLGSRMVAPEM
jgi:hypothetical protein